MPMANYMGVDLGGTKAGFVLADGDGNFLYEKSFPSPFQRTSRLTAGGEPETVIDAEMTDVPADRRVAAYLERLESEFLKEAKRTAGAASPERRGFSLCGKTWVQDGKIVMVGSNSPMRFAADLGGGREGIIVTDALDGTQAANDGNAAATAQGIYYRAVSGIEPRETGYIILGTGFGFGIPFYSALTEIGHIPVRAMPDWLRQECGCTEGRKTVCAENYASGRGLQETARILLAMEGTPELEAAFPGRPGPGPGRLVSASLLKGGNADPRAILDLARDGKDGLASFIEDLAAEVTAMAAVTAALLFGLQVIGAGESIALHHPWHVRRIAEKAEALVAGNNMLRPRLRIEPTPLRDPAKFGALSLVVPVERYEAWASKMAGEKK
jgi:predicted NBD/HSP70 family sugar kinase